VNGERDARVRSSRLLFTVHRLRFFMTIPTTGRILGIDWGEVRIGLALSDESQTLATPLETLVRRAGKRFPMKTLLELTSLHRPVGVVVGLPLAPEGTEGESATSAREMAEAIGRTTGLPLELWDERMSTARALGAVREQGGSTRGRKTEVDALAAAVLLQHFLEARRVLAERAERESTE
jgi:putative holliday junction resolvase